MKKITISKAKEIIQKIDPEATLNFDASAYTLQIISNEKIRKIYRKFISPWIDNVISFDESKGICSVTVFADEKAIEEYKAPAPVSDWLHRSEARQAEGSQAIKDYIGRND